MTVANKIALVTGGNRGIGFAIAQGLLVKNYDVILTSRSLNSAKQATEKLNGTVIPLALDVGENRYGGLIRTTIARARS